jgi:hypothetical protein
MDEFWESINVGWSSKFGAAIKGAGLEHIDFARGFSEPELMEVMRENLHNVGALPFHVYRRNFCVDVPISRAMDTTPPKAKRQRQCTKDLSRNAYMEQMSTDSFSGEDRSRLLMYNKLSSLPMQQKFRDC